MTLNYADPTTHKKNELMEYDQPSEEPAVVGSSDDEIVQRPYNSESMWSRMGKVFVACDVALDELPAGYYVAKSSSRMGNYLERRDLDTDSLIQNLDQNSRAVMADINKFLSSRTKYKQYGFLWKRGYLLYGAPGTGKTSLVQNVSKQFIEQGGIVMFCEDVADLAGCLSMVRTIEPKRPILVLFEEIEQILRYQSEHLLLSILDGELQVDNVIHLATTNYPEMLDARIINRPSRFDIVAHIGYPEYEARVRFLREKTPASISDDTIEMWASATSGMSYAHLKEIIVACLIMDTPFEDVLKRLDCMKQGKFSSDDDKTQNFGFVGN